MISQYIVTPVLGAVIGYFTNWLAIKMIFKPYEEKRIFNIRVPFTPGLMPKERYILSKKVGQIVANNLLTEEVMVKALISNDIHDNINNLIDKTLDEFKKNENILNEIINNIFLDINNKPLDYDIYYNISNKITDAIISILNKKDFKDNILELLINNIDKLLKIQLKDMPIEKFNKFIKNVISDYGLQYINSKNFDNIVEDNVSNYINNLVDNNKTIGELVPEELEQKIRTMIYDKVPTISQFILSLIEIPEVEEKAKDFIVNLINQNVGKLVVLFVSPSKVSESVINSFKQYLSDENNYIKTVDIIIKYLEKLYSMNINEISTKIPEIYKNYSISEFIIKSIRNFCNKHNIENILGSIQEYVTKFDNKSLYDILINIEPDIINKLRQYISEQLNKIINESSLYEYINSTIYSQIDKFMNLSLGEITSNIKDETVVKFKNGTIVFYDFIVKKAMINILKTINLSKIVESKINDFEIKEAEDIVLQVVDKELGAITMIGGLLGFIIGLLPVFIK